MTAPSVSGMPAWVAQLWVDAETFTPEWCAQLAADAETFIPEWMAQLAVDAALLESRTLYVPSSTTTPDVRIGDTWETTRRSRSRRVFRVEWVTDTRVLTETITGRNPQSAGRRIEMSRCRFTPAFYRLTDRPAVAVLPLGRAA